MATPNPPAPETPATPPMPPGPGPGPGSPPPPGYGAAPAAPRRNRWLVPVVVVVVIIVVVLAAVLALGLFKGPSPGGTGSGGSTPDFGTAQSAAASTANGQSGGPWKFYAAFGTAPSYSETTTVNTSFFSFGNLCSSIHLDVANNSQITVSTYGGSLSSGQASAWMFLYASSGGLLVVIDNGGNTFPLATLTCAQVGQLFSSIAGIPASASSSGAAGTAWARGGSAFAASHPATSVDYSLTAGFSLLGVSTPSNWGVSYTACTAADASSGTSAASEMFDINATTNAFIDESNGTTACGLSASPGPHHGGGGGPATLATDLAFGAPSLVSANGVYNETFTVTTAQGGLRWGNISFIEVNQSLTSLLAVGWVNVSMGGPVVASYNLGTDHWDSGSSVPIAVGQTVSITFGPQNPTGQGWAATFFSYSAPAGQVTERFA